MTAAAAYTGMGLVLAVCAAYAFASPLSAVILRARWAWRCRGKPVPGDGERLTRAEYQVLGDLDAGRDVRART